MGKRNMRSRASVKFNKQHPESLKHFRSLFKVAKLRKEFPELYCDPRASEELLNMIKNMVLTRKTVNDSTMACKKRENVSRKKKISWSLSVTNEVSADLGMEL